MNGLTNDDMLGIQRQILWEEARGKLWALHATYRWVPLEEQKRFEAIIKEFFDTVEDVVL